MSKPEILFVGDGPDWYLQRFAQDFVLHRLPGGGAAALDPAVAARVEALVAAGPVDAALIDALPALRLIANAGAGYEKVDVAAAGRRNIPVTNTPDVTDGCVADLALGLLLAVGREIVRGDRFVRDGRWSSGGYPLARRFHGRRMGVLGLGRIGQAIAARARAFDMSIAYHNRRKVPGVDAVHHPSLLSLAAACDYLVVACPGGDATHHLVDRAALEALGPDGIVVNISRGAVIDEQALIEALETGAIAGAGLDVFEHEPEVPERLKALENVVLTPHRGGGTVETWEAACDLVKANLRAFFDGKPLLTPIGEC
ncbi:2-hydroxyacid dehydrogenase [Pikeienuella piscinae]|uniref:2-hydroxyacid dehydrogenase n=1 Tax=Pikeienuella piscinae TaxID=2748098 RepID=A0A7L5BXF3_9RHOB|nr:2-hydroxyacid dehydrogenase [Pikeienuella piscinae]QIE55528.1 2-hydroxyacid dehydrogenase [Pikeienuella piscinae]